MPNKPLCHPVTSHKITQDGREGGKKKRNSTKSLVHAPRENRCEMKHETPFCLILDGVCCAINPLKTCLSKEGKFPKYAP